MKTVSVLFARQDSIYKTLLGCDVYDIDRDARNFQFDRPVICHPPCRAWGRLRHFAKPRSDEKDLAHFAIAAVRCCGGVLEHPAGSLLFKSTDLPLPGEFDSYGGFTYPIYQSWFGHKAPKNTWLYICGIAPVDLPPFPFHLGLAAGRISNNGSMKFREGTPLQLAEWLIALCHSLDRPKQIAPRLSHESVSNLAAA